MEHACDLVERIGDLLFNEKYCDLIFIVEGERLPAHRNIVTTSCEYFRALVEGEMQESLQRDVTLKDIPLRGFKLVMSYVYTGQLQFRDLDEGAILEVLGIAHLYGLEKLENALSQHLQENLSTENVFAIYSTAHLLRHDQLVEACYYFIVDNHQAVLQSDTVCNLSGAALCHMISRDTFCVEELEIFKAVERWRKKHAMHADLPSVVQAIRLPLIETKHLLTTVSASGLVSENLILEAIRTREFHPADEKIRGKLISDTNLANSDRGALILKAKTPKNDGSASTLADYDGEDVPPYPLAFNFHAETGLTIALREPYFINHLAFRIRDQPARCAYYIEVSANLVNWSRIIDHTKYGCMAVQNLFFERRVVRYIRLVGAWPNPESDTIKLSAFEVQFTTKPFKLSCGFYAPEENVASASLGAIVFGSLEKSKGLIREESGDELRTSQWSSHNIGSDPILIELSQPVTVGSMRMLLKSNELRAYKYYIETSLDLKNWTRVADYTADFRRSWQQIVFEAHPIKYIKIKGTDSTVGKVFSCARFECPANSRDVVESSVLGSEVSEIC